jgi:RNA polymerase sigma-70 factor (sigma-E family)
MSDMEIAHVPLVQASTFDDVYTRRTPALFRLAILLVDKPELAEEVVHDAFAKAYERWGRIDDHEAYLRQAVVNRSRDVLRRRRVTRLGRLDRRTPETELGADHLRDAIARLPGRQRAVVVLRFYEDLSVAETARAMRIPEGTVKSDLHRAIAELRKVIEQ